MKRFIAIVIVLLASSALFAALPNGIYLVADSLSEKFYPKAATATVKDAREKIIHIKVFPGPALGDTDLGGVTYDYFPFTRNGKMHVAYGFDFALRNRGHYRAEELKQHQAAFTFVLILDGVSVASGPLFEPVTATSAALEAFCSFADFRATFNAWNIHLRASKDWVSDTFSGEQRSYFLSGRLASQDIYWNGAPLNRREWYPDGKLKSSFDRSLGNPSYVYERDYDPGGSLISWRCRTYPSPYEYYYSRYYAADGTLLYVDSSWTSGGTYFSIERGYDSTGVLSYRLKKTYLEPLPGEDGGGETNWPQVIEEWAYENGQLVSAGQSYAECDICTTYETGVWKFYKNGKLVKTETHEDWKTLDARSRREALAGLQKRQKKKKKK